MWAKRAMVILLVIGSVLFFSCKKETETKDQCTTATEYLSTDIVQLKLKKDSYWVFIDSISMTIDSMYLDSVLYYGMYQALASCPTEKYEGYGFSLRSSVDPSKQDVYRLKGGSMERNSTSLFDVKGWVYLDYNYGTLPTGSNNTVQKKDSLYVYDRYYKHVVIVTRPVDNTEGKKTIYYCNSEFGFLKKEIYSSSNALLSKKVLKSKNVIR